MGVKLKPKMAEELRKHGGELTEDMAEKLIGSMIVKKAPANGGVSIKLSEDIQQKYFTSMNAGQMAEIVKLALEAWFSGKEAAYVQQ